MVYDSAMLTDILVISSLAAIAVGRIPSLRINRAGLALVGAIALILAGSISIEGALSAIDGQTLVLLFAMMVFNANLKLSGFFRWAGSTLGTTKKPRRLLALVMAVSAILSALFINDTAVLMLTPLVVETALISCLNPVPYLIALALAANIGSMATPIGNPQNILIATSRDLGFSDFLGALAIPAIASLMLAYAVVSILYRKDFAVHGAVAEGEEPGVRNPRPATVGDSLAKARIYRPLFYKCLVALATMIGFWGFGAPVALGALAGIAILLVTRRIRPDRIFAEVDWTLLALFAGLFVITKAAAGTATYRALMALPNAGMDGPALGWFAAGLSQIISNVPAVMVLLPSIQSLANPDQTALMLAGVTTLAGNFTLLGSVANLIMAEGARKRGIHVGFMEYFRAGGLLTVITIALTSAWLYRA